MENCIKLKATIVQPVNVQPMKRFRVVDTSKGLWAPIETLKARSFERALQWCFNHGYELIEEV